MSLEKMTTNEYRLNPKKQDKRMLINIDSLKTICGQSNEVVVFGFRRFRYYQTYEAINSMKDMRAYSWSDYQFKMDAVDKSRYKAIINDLVLDNYIRKQNSQPIIPFIFVVGLDHNSLHIERIAVRDNNNYFKGVTLTELRRCYKVAHEFPELKDIANETFKFVELTKHQDHPSEYQFKQVKPFWLHKNWNSLWERRKAETAKKYAAENKHTLWREHFKKQISEVKNASDKENSFLFKKEPC